MSLELGETEKGLSKQVSAARRKGGGRVEAATAQRVVNRFRKGETVERIAAEMKLLPKTVTTYLYRAQRRGEISFATSRGPGTPKREIVEGIHERVMTICDACYRDAEFARAIDVDPATIAAWKKKLSMPRADVLARICEAFDLSADWLLMGKGQTPSLGEVRHVA